LQISLKQLQNNYFRVELPEPRIVYVLVDAFGEMIGVSEIPSEYRGEVQRLITAKMKERQG